MNLKRWQNLSALGLEALKRYPFPEIAKVNLALTMKCNHRCLSCHIWQQNTMPFNEITAQDVKQLIARNNLMWISLSGGEPSLAEDFEEILSICLAKVKLTNIITNGELPGKIVPAVYKALQQGGNNLLIVHLTLFGEPDTHNTMTGTKCSYQRVIETVRGLKSLGYGDRLIIGFEHMLSPKNPEEFKFVQYKANRERIGITYTLEQEAGYYQNRNGGSPVVRIPRISMTLNPIDLFKNSFLLNTSRKAGCVAGEYSLWIMPDLTVYPCFFAIPGKKSFSLRDTNYLLNQGYFAKDREWIDRCAGCWTPCESFTMLLFRPWRILKSLTYTNRR